MTTSQVFPDRVPDSYLLQLAVAGYLARYKGLRPPHGESDPARLPELVRRPPP